MRHIRITAIALIFFLGHLGLGAVEDAKIKAVASKALKGLPVVGLGLWRTHFGQEKELFEALLGGGRGGFDPLVFKKAVPLFATDDIASDDQGAGRGVAGEKALQMRQPET